MDEPVVVFLSYSRNDVSAAANLHAQLDRAGLPVFKDDESIRGGDLGLDRLQDAIGTCGAFVVLVGRDGVQRWVGAETRTALTRHFDPQDDTARLPIFPILLEGGKPESMPVLLQQFQATAWNGTDPLPDSFLHQIRERRLGTSDGTPFKGCPFVGLAAFGIGEAHMFFGRQKETLDALNCFFDVRPGSPPVRWLEISGNSGSGKSSLMQAGLLPLVEKGWLWRPGSRYEDWTRIGPMMPGKHPVEMLAEALAHAFNAGMGDIVEHLRASDDGMRYWLRDRKRDRTAFLLAIDQFEELFTFADSSERRLFDRLLAGALEDGDCPLFLLSTVRTDFLDRFTEDLPRLAAVSNRRGRPWRLGAIAEQGLREAIEGPARLADLDVTEIVEVMIDQARNEPGALPLVENALHFLWRTREGNRLSGRLFTEQGGLAGVLSRSADRLLAGFDADDRTRALELLFQLVRVDPQGSRHARRRLSFAEAVASAGGDAAGRALVGRLAGQRDPECDVDVGQVAGPVRLITIAQEERWVALIHETLIRSKGPDAEGKAQPYWPTLWDYIEAHKERAGQLEKLRVDTDTWLARKRDPGFLWSHERVRELVATLKRVGAEIGGGQRPDATLSDDEREFLGPIDVPAMLAELDRTETSHARRALIGERLGVLGEDPSRWGVGVDPNGTPRIDWCHVGGGEVTIEIRSDPSRVDAEISERLTRTVEPFLMARYPVTVDQFRSFLDDCHRDGQWQLPPGFPANLPLRGRPPKPSMRFGNHPVENVDWFEAVAFCHWLAERLDTEVRLPTEAEWQCAATGGERTLIYPWGPDWDPDQEPWRANTVESGIGRATAVGMYPAGESPAALLDMAGNVWEWCMNLFDDPDRTDLPSPDPRVLRGGSWNYSQSYARAAFRRRGYPTLQINFIGFRVVCSPPSSGSGCRKQRRRGA